MGSRLPVFLIVVFCVSACFAAAPTISSVSPSVLGLGTQDITVSGANFPAIVTPIVTLSIAGQADAPTAVVSSSGSSYIYFTATGLNHTGALTINVTDPSTGLSVLSSTTTIVVPQVIGQESSSNYFSFTSAASTGVTINGKFFSSVAEENIVTVYLANSVSPQTAACSSIYGPQSDGTSYLYNCVVNAMSSNSGYFSANVTIAGYTSGPAVESGGLYQYVNYLSPQIVTTLASAVTITAYPSSISSGDMIIFTTGSCEAALVADAQPADSSVSYTPSAYGDVRTCFCPGSQSDVSCSDIGNFNDTGVFGTLYVRNPANIITAVSPSVVPAGTSSTLTFTMSALFDSYFSNWKPSYPWSIISAKSPPSCSGSYSPSFSSLTKIASSGTQGSTSYYASSTAKTYSLCVCLLSSCNDDSDYTLQAVSFSSSTSMPSISSVNSFGAGTQVVTIYGSNFGSNVAAVSVQATQANSGAILTAVATSITSWPTIIATVSNIQASFPVSFVVAVSGAASPVYTMYNSPSSPSVSGVSTVDVNTTTITITGSYFSSKASDNVVTLNLDNASPSVTEITSATNSQLVCTIQGITVPGSLRVTVSVFGQSDYVTTTIAPPPIVTSISPNSLVAPAALTTITLTGSSVFEDGAAISFVYGSYSCSGNALSIGYTAQTNAVPLIVNNSKVEFTPQTSGTFQVCYCFPNIGSCEIESNYYLQTGLTLTVTTSDTYLTGLVFSTPSPIRLSTWGSVSVDFGFSANPLGLVNIPGWNTYASWTTSLTCGSSSSTLSVNATESHQALLTNFYFSSAGTYYLCAAAGNGASVMQSGISVVVFPNGPLVTPTSTNVGLGLRTLTITGSTFGSSPTITLSIGSTPIAASIVSVDISGSQIVCTAFLPIVGSLQAVVTSAGQSSGSPVTVYNVVSPMITSSLSNIGAGYQAVTINGFYFGQSNPAAGQIFNVAVSVGANIPCVVDLPTPVKTYYSDTQIVCWAYLTSLGTLSATVTVSYQSVPYSGSGSVAIVVAPVIVNTINNPMPELQAVGVIAAQDTKIWVIGSYFPKYNATNGPAMLNFTSTSGKTFPACAEGMSYYGMMSGYDVAACDYADLANIPVGSVSATVYSTNSISTTELIAITYACADPRLAAANAALSGMWSDDALSFSISANRYINHGASASVVQPCSNFFTARTLAMLGSNPACSVWEEAIFVQLGANPTITSQSVVETVSIPIVCGAPIAAQNVSLSYEAPSPKAIIMAPTSVSSCMNTTIDGSLSSGTKISYSWSCAFCSSALSNFLAGVTTPVITINPSLITNFNIMLTVTDFFGLSNTATFNTYSGSTNAPVVYGISVNSIDFNPASNYQVTARVYASTCNSNPNITVSWSGCSVVAAGLVATIPANSVSSRCTLSLTVNQGGYTSSASYSFTPITAPLPTLTISTQAAINTGSPISARLTINGNLAGPNAEWALCPSAGYDVATGICYQPVTDFLLARAVTASPLIGNTITLSPSGRNFTAGSYYLLAAYLTSGGSVINANTMITLVQGTPVSVSIQCPNNFIAASSIATVSASSPVAGISYAWTATGGVLATPSNILTTVNSAKLVLAAYSLEPGMPYTFTVVASGAGLVSSSASCSITVADVPSNGVVNFVNAPATVYSVNTMLTLTTGLWASTLSVAGYSSDPFLYQFTYVPAGSYYEIPLSSFGPAASVSFAAPVVASTSTITFKAYCMNIYGAIGVTSTTLTINPSNVSPSTLIDSLSKSVSAGTATPQSVISQVTNIAIQVANSNNAAASANTIAQSINYLAQYTSAITVTTSSDIVARANALNYLTAQPAALTQSSVSNSINLANNLLQLANNNLSPNVSASLIDSLMNTVVAANKNGATSQIVSAQSSIDKTIIAALPLANGASLSLSTESSTVGASRNTASGLQGATVSNYGNSVTFPNAAFLSTSSPSQQFSVVTTVWSSNPYASAPMPAKAKALGSKVLSVSVLNSTAVVPVSGLATPITIQIQATGDISPKSASCQYFDTTTNSWSTNGCSVVSVTDSLLVTCSCNHLTDFAVFQMPVTITPKQLLGLIALIIIPFAIAGVWWYRKRQASKNADRYAATEMSTGNYNKFDA